MPSDLRPGQPPPAAAQPRPYLRGQPPAASSPVGQGHDGVDLDQEAVNLIRYQQAFQASGRVMQVAADIIDTMLGIR